MNHNYRHSKVLNFLLELILAMFFLTLAAVVCTSLFAHASNKYSASKMINEATMLGQSYAEQMRLYKGESMSEYLKCTIQQTVCQVTITVDDNTYLIEIDTNVKDNAAGIVYKSRIQIINKNQILFKEEVMAYVQK